MSTRTKNYEACSVIYAGLFNKALKSVPDWALKEIRRKQWYTRSKKVDYRSTIAALLNKSGKEILPLLKKYPHQVLSIYLTALALKEGREKKIGLLGTMPWKKAIRAIFKGYTNQSINYFCRRIEKGVPTYKWKGCVYTETGKEPATHCIPSTFYLAGLKETPPEIFERLTNNPARPDILGTRVPKYAREVLLKQNFNLLRQAKRLEKPKYWASQGQISLNDLWRMVYDRRVPEMKELYREALLKTTNYKELKYLHDVVSQDHNRLMMLKEHKDLEKKLPAPIIPGNDQVQHLDTGLALVEEGSKMNHCVGSYIDAAKSGRYSFYHVTHGEETATVQLHSDKTVRQLYGPQNNRVSKELRSLVHSWINSTFVFEGHRTEEKTGESVTTLPTVDPHADIF